MKKFVAGGTWPDEIPDEVRIAAAEFIAAGGTREEWLQIWTGAVNDIALERRRALRLIVRDPNLRDKLID
jgi:hypothetical protein